ncbi:transcription factor 25 [Folsomia candida]|uniref:transcription factor 25 n=1 Tax=Folsomia candida TaxID=158441 RepID=UPI000B907D2E|nr:transcription factor 25 [Folsomia candida]
MSNRVFKKVFGGGDELGAVSPTSEDEAPVALFTKSKKALTINPYQLLNDDLSESEEKGGDDEDAAAAGAEEDSSKPDDDNSQATTTKKKRRKKRPGKKKNDNNDRVGGGSSAVDTELEDAEESQRQKQQKATTRPTRKNESDAVSSSSGKTAFEELFKIDSKYLNSEFELKRIFGSKVINYERSKAGQRRIYRHSKLVMPKEQWPSVSGSGISMSYLNTVDGYPYFKFDHNLHYQDVQKEFMRAVDTLNPDNIVSILRLHPYHIDSHIQLSDMAKSAEDMSVAADLVEGAIHCLENAFHVRFCLNNPACRLDYKFQENRPFFILLFKHLVFVGQRACHRTALELCKRLLCLDPVSDPLCATLMIDFYALKGNEAQWFVDLYRFWEKPKNLDQLPNFSYSIALAHHLLSLKENPEIELSQKADALIQYAVLMFPSVLLPLLEKVGVQIDNRAKHHNYLNSFAQSSQSRSLRLLCELYVWRTHHVWKEPSVLGWLEKNVTIILDRVDASDPVVKDYEGKRKRRYLATTPRNILRHVLLTDNKDLTFNFPPELSKEPILNYDPLPPPDAVDIYNMKEFQTRRTRTGTGRGGILNMLLDSLWNDLNAVPPNDQPPQLGAAERPPARLAAADGENPPIALGAGLQQSVTALLDAMRDLLTNANGRPEGEAADGEDSATDADARED